MKLTKRGGSYNNDLVGTWYQQKYDSSGNLISESGFENRTFSVDNGWFSGQNIDRYHQRKRKGELLPMTSFSKYTCKGETGGKTYLLDTSNGDYWGSKQPYTKFTHWVLTEEIVRSYAPSSYDDYVQYAAASIYSSGHDTLTFLAELTDVYKMFLSTGKLLTKLLRDGIPVISGKGVASKWLEMRYGWRPLINDIKSLNEAITNIHTGKKRYKESKGRTLYDSDIDSYSEGSTFVWDHDICDSIEIGIRGCVVADVDVPEFQFNPLITGWELVPFSFVVDWFISIGKSLSALAFLRLQPSYVSSKGLRITVQRNYDAICHDYAQYVAGSEQHASCTAVLELREPCRISLKPLFKLNIDFYKVFDLVGMIIQRK